MHRLSTAFVHGCDEDVAENLLSGHDFRASQNAYDWLGSGVYFWEANPLRGLEFVQELQRRPNSKIKTPSVVGAVIELGHCLDLLSSTGVNAVEYAHESFLQICRVAEIEVPRNRVGEDLLLRDLDCAVINHLHKVRVEAGMPAFQTVRGVFVEGERIYENSGFRAKTHIQICVRDHDCIKGVFRVPGDQLKP